MWLFSSLLKKLYWFTCTKDDNTDWRPKKLSDTNFSIIAKIDLICWASLWESGPCKVLNWRESAFESESALVSELALSRVWLGAADKNVFCCFHRTRLLPRSSYTASVWLQICSTAAGWYTQLPVDIGPILETKMDVAKITISTLQLCSVEEDVYADSEFIRKAASLSLERNKKLLWKT